MAASGGSLRARRWAKRVAGSLAAVLILAFAAAPAIAHHLLEKERARIRAAGEPLTVSEVVPALPTGTPNAADVYQQAFDALDITQDEGELIDLDRMGEVTPEWIAAARPLIERNSRYFGLLTQASQIERCVFPVDWEEGATATEPHLAGLREAARMANARAIVLAADAGTDDALRCCALIPAMVQHLSGEPTIVGQLVRYALLAVGVRGVERVLKLSEPGAEAARGLCKMLGQVNLSDSVLHGARGERVLFGASAYSRLREDLDARPGLGETVFRAKTDLDEWLYLRGMREQMEALALPWPEAKDRAGAVLEKAIGQPPPVGIGTALMLPNLGRVAESCRFTEGRRDVCAIGLAAEAYRSEHGRYPDSLEELAADGWEVPRDSFVEAAYRYRREGDGFMVWGVGPDLDDDGGKRFAPSRGDVNDPQSIEDDYDVVFGISRR